jgi:hypothetical protein
MDLGQDIYIVYSKADDDPKDPKSWIFNFHRFLELLLTRLSSQKISIKYVEDKALDMDEIYTTSLVLIPLVSENMLKSANFNEEMKKYHERAINKEHNNISWNSRVFKIMRRPLKQHYLLDFLSNAATYNFYHVDAATDELVSYDDFTGPQSQKTFWTRLYDLAYDAYQILERLASAEDEIARINHDINAINVFLALTGEDITRQRDLLKRELIRSGYRVFPESHYPDDLETCMKMIKKDLDKCHMSVHLVGADYTKIKGTNVSMTDLQNRLAIENFDNRERLTGSDTGTFGRVIWISPELGSVSVKQRLFIENLKKDPETLHNTDLLELTIEEIKTFVINKLESSKVAHGYTTTTEKKKVVYLITDQEEENKVEHIRNYLLKNGYSVLVSQFTGDPDKIRQEHNENLKRCDATLIYYGNTNKAWMQSKLNDTLKALGLGRDKPISSKAILIEDEKQMDELLAAQNDTMVLRNTGQFNPKTIEPFLTKLEQYS